MSVGVPLNICKMNCKRRVKELCQLTRELHVFEQLLRGDLDVSGHLAK